MKPELFGSWRRTQALLTVRAFESANVSQIASAMDVRLYVAQRIIEDFENEGLIATRLDGNARWVELNPRYFAVRELVALLDRYLEAAPEFRDQVAAIRRRPRKRGKEI